MIRLDSCVLGRFLAVFFLSRGLVLLVRGNRHLTVPARPSDSKLCKREHLKCPAIVKNRRNILHLAHFGTQRSQFLELDEKLAGIDDVECGDWQYYPDR